ncbi:MAG: hypothetical protein JWP94_3870, partial [Mucilaginibacter sp.]|nr:hypothetical protein [Mucilaginibacter sp.]
SPGHGGPPGDDLRWWEQGEEPDYRATLANERTFLAWTRTALALLASSLALVQFTHLTPVPLRLALAAYLIALAVAVIVTGYYRWRTVQHRMRHKQPLGRSPQQPLIVLAFLVLAALVCVITALTTR